MKKISVLIMIAMMVVVFSPVAEAKSETAGTGTGTSMPKTTVSPTTGSGVANQNQVKTQNAGEEQQLNVQTAEQEETSGVKSVSPRSDSAIQNMGEVAKGVEEILTTKTLKGGIGDQVRVLAQEQKQSQDQVRLQINKVASRSGLLKNLIGPDYKALSSIKEQIVQNELRIQQLTELMSQLTNSGDIRMVQETIDALIQQNVSLQEIVDTENSQGSIFGWLIRLFVK
jgi:hypothetical protein